MYIVWTDTADEYTRIKVTLGTGAKRVTTAHDVIESLEHYIDCRIAIIGSSIKESAALELATSLRVSHPFVNVILMRNRIDLSTLSNALAAGVRDVVDSQEASSLVNAVKRCEEIDHQITSRHSEQSHDSNLGKVIVVYSAKGGCGKTTLATNLAAALANAGSQRVCLLDLDLQFGDVAVALRLEPTKTISHALEMKEGLDAQGLAPLLVRYDDAFDTLLAPTSPSDIEFIAPEFIQRVILTLQSMYDFVIVDSSPAFNDNLIKALESADLVLLMTTLDMPAIKNLKVAIATLDALGFPTSERRIVVNRADAKVGLTVEDVEEFVGVKVFASIPSSPEVSASTNQGAPIVIAHPKHPVSKSISQIAHAIVEINHGLEVEAVA